MTATPASRLVEVFSRSCWNEAGALAVPSRFRLHHVLDLLLEALFPGFYGVRPIKRVDLPHVLDALLSRVFCELVPAVREAGAACGGVVGDAESIVRDFERTLPELRAVLNEDLEAAYRGDPAARSLVEITLAYPFVEVVATYRLAHELHVRGVPLIPRVWTERAHSRTGADIHPGAVIGRGFFVDHCTGVVIGETAILGDRVKLYQGVTLGALSFPRDAEGNVLRGTKRHPTVGDDVTIYAGASVLGGETVIGNGAVIGGNVWLVHSVPPGSIVMQPEAAPRVRTRGRIET